MIVRSALVKVGHRQTNPIKRPVHQTCTGRLYVHKQRATLVAEGVDSDEQRAVFASIGCTSGRVLSPPLPIETFATHCLAARYSALRGRHLTRPR